MNTAAATMAPLTGHPRLTGPLPLLGADVWRVPELIWCNPRGKPQRAQLQLTLPCDSPAVPDRAEVARAVAAWADRQAASPEVLREAWRQSLIPALWGGQPVRSAPGVRLDWPAPVLADDSESLSLDRLDIDAAGALADPALLRAATEEKPVAERLSSELLRMPAADGGWESARLVWHYHGPQIDEAALLSYLLGWQRRQVPLHQWADVLAGEIARHCHCTQYALVLSLARREGIAITAWRSSHPQAMPRLAPWLPQ